MPALELQPTLAESPETAPAGTRLRVLPAERPITRGDCSAVQRPCPFTSCRYHLAIERRPRRAGQAPATSEASCSLDVADEGGVTLTVVGEAFGVTRERSRQIEAQALRRLAEQLERRGIIGPGELERALGALRGGLLDAGDHRKGLR